jgi:hypothetical protein
MLERQGSLRYALAGFQAGAFGVLVMLAWFYVSSSMTRHSPWTVPNLYAIAVRGQNAYVPWFATGTWSGLALIFAIYSLSGALWGLIWRDRQPGLGVLLGAIAGLAAWFFWFGFFWKQAQPLIPLYAADRQLQIGHVLWGMSLARSGRYVRELAGATR